MGKEPILKFISDMEQRHFVRPSLMIHSNCFWVRLNGSDLIHVNAEKSVSIVSGGKWRHLGVLHFDERGGVEILSDFGKPVP